MKLAIKTSVISVDNCRVTTIFLKSVSQPRVYFRIRKTLMKNQKTRPYCVHFTWHFLSSQRLFFVNFKEGLFRLKMYELGLNRLIAWNYKSIPLLLANQGPAVKSDKLADFQSIFCSLTLYHKCFMGVVVEILDVKSIFIGHFRN